MKERLWPIQTLLPTLFHFHSFGRLLLPSSLIFLQARALPAHILCIIYKSTSLNFPVWISNTKPRICSFSSGRMRWLFFRIATSSFTLCSRLFSNHQVSRCSPLDRPVFSVQHLHRSMGSFPASPTRIVTVLEISFRFSQRFSSGDTLNSWPSFSTPYLLFKHFFHSTVTANTGQMKEKRRAYSSIPPKYIPSTSVWTAPLATNTSLICSFLKWRVPQSIARGCESAVCRYVHPPLQPI